MRNSETKLSPTKIRREQIAKKKGKIYDKGNGDSIIISLELFRIFIDTEAKKADIWIRNIYQKNVESYCFPS